MKMPSADELSWIKFPWVGDLQAGILTEGVQE